MPDFWHYVIINFSGRIFIMFTHRKREGPQKTVRNENNFINKINRLQCAAKDVRSQPSSLAQLLLRLSDRKYQRILKEVFRTNLKNKRTNKQTKTRTEESRTKITPQTCKKKKKDFYNLQSEKLESSSKQNIILKETGFRITQRLKIPKAS